MKFSDPVVNFIERQQEEQTFEYSRDWVDELTEHFCDKDDDDGSSKDQRKRSRKELGIKERNMRGERNTREKRRKEFGHDLSFTQFYRVHLLYFVIVKSVLKHQITVRHFWVVHWITISKLSSSIG